MQNLEIKNMRQFLIKIYNSVNASNHFIVDLVSVNNGYELDAALIGRKYFRDSDNRKLLGVCRKFEIVHELL